VKNNRGTFILALFFAVGVAALLPYWRLGDTMLMRILIGAMEITFIFTGVSALLIQDTTLKWLHDEHPSEWEKLGRPLPIFRFRFRGLDRGSFPSWDIFYKIMQLRLGSSPTVEYFLSTKRVFLFLVIINILSGATFACFVYFMANEA